MKKNKTTALKILLSLFIVAVLTVNVFPKIIANQSEQAFLSPGQEHIRVHIIEAAGYFLKSQSDFLLFLHRFEMSELGSPDFYKLRRMIASAAANMERAKKKYETLTQLADNTPFDPTVVSALGSFDYTTFQNRKGTKVNNTVFNRLKDHLDISDVPSVYRKLVSDTQHLLGKLLQVKSAVDSDTMPRTALLWQLYQSYSETHLFGQYTAEIFYKITGK
jgi:hypothetical protein